MAHLQPDEVANLNEFYAGGPTSFAEAFPPVCVGTHWDPMRLQRHVLPTVGTLPPQVLDPRQAVQVCRQYYTESPADALPDGLIEPAQSPVIPEALRGPAYTRAEEPGPLPIPPGSAASLGTPYSLYAQSVGKESDLLRLEERLTKCKELRYQPRPDQLAADQTNVLPNHSPELAYPQNAPVELPRTPALCREQDDKVAWNRSARFFFNSTKLDRYHPDQKMGPMVCDAACKNPTEVFFP